VRDARVIDLCNKVNFLVDETLPPMGARVSIVTTAKKTYSAATDRPRGHPLNPLSLEEVKTKFRSCAGLVLSKERTEAVLEMLLHIDELKRIDALVEALCDR